MSLTIHDGDTIAKDPNDRSVLHWDWDTEHLAPGVVFATTPTVTAAALSGDTTTTALAIDQVAVLAGNRKVRFRISTGAAGSQWRVICNIVTNETPAQTKERSIFVNVVDR